MKEKSKEESMGELVYRCSCCGETQQGIPDLAFAAPCDPEERVR